MRFLELGSDCLLVAIGDDAVLVLVAEHEFDLHAGPVSIYERVGELLGLLGSYLGECQAEVEVLPGLEGVRPVPRKAPVFRVGPGEIGHRGVDLGVIVDRAVGLEYGPRLWERPRADAGKSSDQPQVTRAQPWRGKELQLT